MPMNIEAVSTIIEWDGELSRMVIANPGDVVEAGDALAAAKIETGEAKKTKKKVAALGGDVVEAGDAVVVDEVEVAADPAVDEPALAVEVETEATTEEAPAA